MDLLNQELVAGYSVLEVGGVVIGLIILISVFKALFKKAPERKGVISASCACGWRGQVGAYNRRCPRCNAALKPQ
ncbi:hypothetical protein KKF91_01800 [Myxococcota bacterium]|nr:hypothetical protein [Myxococcota bacterium]MBU1429270.1 hypothetical protein [Myxococcota bacterium]MBU1897288.1 hypothetical protein [Myxococcota bacterium]